MQFDFVTSNHIIFGRGRFQEIGEFAAGYGSHALVITGSTGTYTGRLEELLGEQSVTYDCYQVSGEPTVESIQEALSFAKDTRGDCVIGIGGGSVIDTGKAVAALLSNEGDLFDYLEVIGRGKPLSNQPVPFLAIPTTSGTGSEVTRNAVIGSPEDRVKVSLRSPRMLPSLALVDPELTLSVPQDITAATGMDALTQVIEPFVSKHSNPLTDSLCKAGIVKAAQALSLAYTDGNDIVVREEMAFASLMGGLALANAKLGAVHGFAGVLGGMYPAPHGAVCGRLLPAVMKINVSALRERSGGDLYLERYTEVARMLTGNPYAAAEDGVAWVEDLVDRLELAHLGEYGVDPNEFPAVIERSKKSSSMKGNPIELLDEELVTILQVSL